MNANLREITNESIFKSIILRVSKNGAPFGPLIEYCGTTPREVVDRKLGIDICRGLSSSRSLERLKMILPNLGR